MKIQGNEIKPGMIIELDNDHWTVLKTQHVKPGKGGAFNQVELKSLTRGTKLNERFRSSENVQKAQLEEKQFNFLYSDDNECFFMEPKTFEQIRSVLSGAGFNAAIANAKKNGWIKIEKNDSGSLVSLKEKPIETPEEKLLAFVRKKTDSQAEITN